MKSESNLNWCIGWIGLAVLTGFRVGYVDSWPGDSLPAGNSTDPLRFLSKSTVDTYCACTWVASLTTLLFGVFKCRSMAEILFGLSEADAQLELQEKHYEKLKVWYGHIRNIYSVLSCCKKHKNCYFKHFDILGLVLDTVKSKVKHILKYR